MTIEDYLVLIESMDVASSRNTTSYAKPVLILTLIEMIDKGVVHDNLFSKENDIFKRTYQKVWNCCVDYKSTQQPDFNATFLDLENDLFWHIYKSDNLAFLDDELYDFLQVKLVRDKIFNFILKRFLNTNFETYQLKILNDVSFSGTIYEDGNIQPNGIFLLTSRPQWQELSTHVISLIEEHFEKMQSSLSDEGKKLANTCIPTSESFYTNILLYISEETKDSLLPLKLALQTTLQNIENEFDGKLKHSYLSTMLTLAKSQIDWWDNIESGIYYIQKSEDIVPLKELKVLKLPEYNILVANDEAVYETTNHIVIVDTEAYTIYRDDSTLSISKIENDGDKYYTGNRILLALLGSNLYQDYNPIGGLDLIDQFSINESGRFYNICYDGLWYNHLGSLIGGVNTLTNNNEANQVDPIIPTGDFNYIPHGRYGKFERYTKSPYVNLLMISLADTLNCPIQDQPETVSFKELAFRMIANAWELLYRKPDKKSTFTALTKYIEYLISYSSTVSENCIHWYSSKDLILNTIQSLPLTEEIQDMVNVLMNNTSFNLLKPWINTNNKVEIMFKSHQFEDNCLYAIKLDDDSNYIKFNPKKKRMLATEHDFMQVYYGDKFLNYEKI